MTDGRGWWAVFVFAFILSAAVLVSGSITIEGPSKSTATVQLGTNTATVGQVPTADGSGNFYWSDAQTNSAGGGGGGGSITGEVQYIWADSVPLETTNPPAIQFATNAVNAMGFPYMAFDKDSQEWVGPQTIHTADNWNSNIVFEIDSYAGATGIVQYLFRVQGVDGVSITYTSSEYVVNSTSITNMDSHTWALSATDYNAGTYYAYEFASITTNLIATIGRRAGDHNIQQVKSIWISE